MYREVIKVLHLTRNMGIGGLERVIFDICRTIDRTMFDISVCCMHFKGEFGEKLERLGIPVHVLPNTREVDYLSFLKVHKLLKREKPHILHTHNSHAFIDGTISGILSHVPNVIHTDHARNFPDKRRIMYAERICASFASKIVAVSEHTRDNLVHYEGIPREKIEVIYNGISELDFGSKIDETKKKAELGIDACAPIIGLGVRLSPQKGISYLLKAVKVLHTEFPNLLLIVAGKGELSNELLNETASLGINDHVRFIGPRMDWNEILQVLDVYVLPSVWEGLPLAVLEAMAARKPIIATSVGGVPSAIIDGQTGLLVPARDVQELAKGIRLLLNDKVLAQRLATTAYERFSEHFSIQTMVRNYQRLYQQLATRKKD